MAGLEQVVVLKRCRTFRFTGGNKKELLWDAHYLLCGKRTATGLFSRIETAKPVLPKLDSSVVEDLYDELELIGVPVSVRMLGDFVTDKTGSKHGDYMKFGTFLDVNGDFFDTVHFSKSLKTYPLRGNGIYLIEGKIALEFGCPAIEVHKCGRMPLKLSICSKY